MFEGPRYSKRGPHDNICPGRLIQGGEVRKNKLELKVLPSHLKYAFLDEGGGKPLIINSSLSSDQEAQLLEILKANEGAIGWALTDLKEISPSFCMHKIHMEEDFKPVSQSQRRLNPTMKEVVRK